MTSAYSSVRSNSIGQHDSGFSTLNIRPVPIGQASGSVSETLGNRSKEFSMLSGFDSVREALSRTSSAIKDIDRILEKK